MRPALLSLALLGTTARGCFFRGDTPGDSSYRIRLGNLRGGSIPGEPLVTQQAEEISVRERRVVGKRVLRDACSDNDEFEGCHRDKGSALHLEECLRKRSHTISGTCLEGIEKWKTLLSETSPGARYKRSPGDKEPQGRVTRFHSGELGARDDARLTFPEDASGVLVEEDEALTRKHSFSRAGGRPDHGPFGGGPPNAHPPHHHRSGPPWEHHPPPRHFGERPRFGPLGGRPPHHEAGPGPAPSMFSVLADWLFATSDSSSDSSSDSLDSSSVDNFEDGFEAGFGAGIDAGIDAGFFPAGHPGRPGGGRVGSPRGVDFNLGLTDGDGPAFEAPPLVRLDLDVPDLFKEDSVQGLVRLRPPSRPLSSKRKRPFNRAESTEEEMPLEMDILNRYAEDMLREKPGGEQLRPQHARHPGGLPGPHHGGGDRGSRDHIRFRNRHPEDHNPWFADSLDSFDSAEDFDLVEGILALFFLIGFVTIVLLPFFLLARALRKLSRHAHGGHGGEGAPDGYQALPEDDAGAAAAVSVSGQQRGGNDRVEDDDGIVVTGTPVNPPPSVHL